jgi:hypothetical protein
MNLPSDKSELLARISSTRTALVGDLSGLGHALDVPSRLRSSFRLHPLAWVGGAVVVGVAVAALFRKGGKGGGLSQWRPMVLGALGFLGNRALTLSMPALGEVMETELNRWLERRRPAEKNAGPQDGQVRD